MNDSKLVINRTGIFSSDNVKVNNQGTMNTAPAGQVTNIDLKMLDDNFLTGGILRTLNAQFGDYVHFQVVDVDNILGLGHDLVLDQYCSNWYMRDDCQEQLNEEVSYTAKIFSGLYLRLIYHSFGEKDVIVTANYRLHKALY